MIPHIDRRSFLHSTLATTAALAAGAAPAAEQKKTKLKKAVKYGMIKIDGSIEEKFKLIKSLGFQGVEVDSPSNIDKDEAVKARDKTGIVIHGVIDSVHWRDTLSDPNEKVRAKGLAAFKGALDDAKLYGADTVLLVPGVVKKDVTYEQCWKRSSAEVRKAIPLAEKNNVKIAVEVVWNNFITKPEQLIEYVDQFKTPYVGAYFDCSNMLKYGVKSGDWIRKLGKRMLKFDFKGFNLTKFQNKENPWVPIGEGSEDWPDVLKALAEVGYNGWATAEVGGGGRKRLQEIADRMKRVLEQ
ncbi:MAG TPA: sugar phosphate isomerase/epimerase family protein [Gemmataceae bacterium]|nr:sugar phosphate isomerase/epimerase family protein [Gemmataceae bacterium]